ncbi:6-phosphogluconolactonase [bacterium]
MKNIYEFENMSELSNDLVETTLTIINETLKNQPTVSIVLSGGKTSAGFYEKFAQRGNEVKLDWNKIHFFLTDERHIPLYDERSNFHMIAYSFIRYIEIDDINLNKVCTRVSKPESMVAIYEHKCRKYFKNNLNTKDIRFDIVFLGIGEDGHTASLFPNDKTIDTDQGIYKCIEISPLEPKFPRITMTLKTINSAKNVIVISGGEKKRAYIEAIKNGTLDASLPIAKVKPNGKLSYYFYSG